jgi:hypothetical protein
MVKVPKVASVLSRAFLSGLSLSHLALAIEISLATEEAKSQ